MRAPYVTIILPAYNAAATLERTIADIPFEYVSQLVLVDDASSDHTVDVAKRLATTHPRLTMSREEFEKDPTLILFSVVEHENNTGYGGNQKHCYDMALADGADIVVMLHPDYQYDPKLVKYFVEFIRDGYFDVMLGSRIRTRQEALAGGMPAYKYYANRFLTLIENIASGRSLGEWHTGMRAYTKEVLLSIPYTQFSNDFIFDTQMLFAIAERNYAIGDIPVPVRYFAEASSINFKRSLRYGLLTLWETLRFVIRTAQWIRYGIAGLLAVAFNIGMYGLLLSFSSLHYTAASVIAFWSGIIVSFTLQKYWTFNRMSPATLPREIPLYLSLVGFNSLLNAGFLFLFVHSGMLSQFPGGILSNLIVAVWSFFIYKHVTFVRESAVK